MARQVERICRENILLKSCKYDDGKISGDKRKYKDLLKKSGSPLTCLQDLLFSKPSLPEGAVPHLLHAKPEERPVLENILTKFKDIFLPSLPTYVPPQRGLGDEHKINLKAGAKPAAKKLYRHSPQE